jgi:hypothetical protein
VSALLELAARVEALMGADREVNALVWAASVGGYIEGSSIWFDDKGWVKHAVSLGDGMVRERTRLGDPATAPRYTASLDDALTLVPEGWRLSMLTSDSFTARWHAVLWVRDGTVDLRPNVPDGSAATPALALTAAALRARAALSTAPSPSDAANPTPLPLAGVNLTGVGAAGQEGVA